MTGRAGCACRRLQRVHNRQADPALQKKQPDATRRYIVLFGILAGLFASAMAVLAFRTGVTQEFFEFIHPPQEYADKLVEQATVLRVAFSLDNLFLLAYSGFFLWFVIERRGKADPTALGVLIGSLLLASLLDAVENFHVLAMLNRAEMHQLPSEGEIELQYVLAHGEVHRRLLRRGDFRNCVPTRHDSGPRRGASTAVLFPILGVLVFTTPAPWSDLCGLGRFLFFVLGFFLSAIVYWNRPNPAAGPCLNFDLPCGIVMSLPKCCPVSTDPLEDTST